jgi:hypothetical protein
MTDTVVPGRHTSSWRLRVWAPRALMAMWVIWVVFCTAAGIVSLWSYQTQPPSWLQVATSLTALVGLP